MKYRTHCSVCDVEVRRTHPQRVATCFGCKRRQSAVRTLVTTRLKRLIKSGKVEKIIPKFKKSVEIDMFAKWRKKKI